jgi:hypothetical protein
MIWSVLLLGGCQILVFACMAGLASRWYHRERQKIVDEISEAIESFVKSPDADTPSPFAMLLDQAALLLAARLVQQLKAMMAGVESGEAKGQQLAMIEQASEGNPLVALIAGILPARIRNKLLKNPQMIGALARFGGGGNHQSTPVAGSTPTSFSL